MGCAPCRILRLLICILTGVAACWSADTTASSGLRSCYTATLHNGFVIRYERHEIVGDSTRLWMCPDAGSGYVEFPTGQIEELAQGREILPPEGGQAGRLANSIKDVRQGKAAIQELIVNTALKYHIDPDFVVSVVKAESNFNATIVSSKGATGLMQLMPETASMLKVADILDPAANVEGGIKYLRSLLDLYQGDAIQALAAYNAGPQRVALYGGVPPFAETRDYIGRIITDYNQKKHQTISAASTPE